MNIEDCGEGKFDCGGGTCIKSEYQCDGENDCKTTGKDEEKCTGN